MPRASPLSLQAGDGINQCEGLLRVVAVGSGHLNGERNPATVANQMTFAAQLGSVGWIRSRLQPPKTARIELPSTTARDQSIFPSAPASPARRSGSVARCPPLASHVTAASRSCPNRNPVPVAASPREFRYAEQTEFPLNKHGLVSGVCLCWVCAVRAAAAVESDSTKHREAKEGSWTDHASTDRNSFPIPATGKK
jgi:hypothetical protein